MVVLQQINKSQLVKLLDAINSEGVDNQFWAVDSYAYSWNAAKVFGGVNQTKFKPGRYIKVMYDNENPFPVFDENLNIITSFPHYDYWIEEDLRVLIFKI